MKMGLAFASETFWANRVFGKRCNKDLETSYSFPPTLNLTVVALSPFAMIARKLNEIVVGRHYDDGRRKKLYGLLIRSSKEGTVKACHLRV
mmetsp:Transcript_16962/g.41347  ORF Transcript_16962/g.41347 Transcript_16962/m.41347 type:complete len:91 (-) Transcript_16962:99-371(-)